MEILLEFTGQNITLPTYYQYDVQSLIYRLLSVNADYSDFIHNSGYQNKEKRFKLFTFGRLRGAYHIQNDKIVFHNGFIVEIRTTECEFIAAVIKATEHCRNYTLRGNKINLNNITLKNTIVFDNSVQIKTVSPITVYKTLPDGKTVYFTPNQKDFYEAILKNAVNKAQSHIKMCDLKNMEIEPLLSFEKMKKTVTQYKGIFITGWDGVFRLKAAPAFLNFLYQTGVGAKNSQGFGMFDICDNQ